jgi:glycine C-acetyltransferase
VEYTVNAFKDVAQKLKDGKYSNEKFADIFNQ